MKVLLSLLFIIILLPSAGAAGAESCNVWAYVTDPDPNGLNVRDNPGGNIIGVIETVGVATTLSIDDSYRGWFHYHSADVLVYDEAEDRREPPPSGWVHGSMLRVDPQGGTYGQEGGGLFLYSEPYIESAKVARLEEASMEVKLIGCQDGWVKIKMWYVATGEGYTGWLHPGDYCASPVTTCS